ncbi:hydroxyacylglutathione hydrolase [Striga asiatica]|uniref:Hydroxyacylglutathione hydrolase n=1 Tax=Striga asiatica TaxID=4170 RepID=A0A5A7QXA0_STRAF|nr:hydroxyacylglutathione hydrolase [Striga asiatica]
MCCPQRGGNQKVLELPRNYLSIIIRNGANTKINNYNWVLGIQGGKPQLRVQIDGHLFCVKDLLVAGGCGWDEAIVKTLFEEEPAVKILQIKSLNPRASDIWGCSFLSKGSFFVKDS